MLPDEGNSGLSVVFVNHWEVQIIDEEDHLLAARGSERGAGELDHRALQHGAQSFSGCVEVHAHGEGVVLVGIQVLEHSSNELGLSLTGASAKHHGVAVGHEGVHPERHGGRFSGGHGELTHAHRFAVKGDGLENGGLVPLLEHVRHGVEPVIEYGVARGEGNALSGLVRLPPVAELELVVGAVVSDAEGGSKGPDRAEDEGALEGTWGRGGQLVQGALQQAEKG